MAWGPGPDRSLSFSSPQTEDLIALRDRLCDPTDRAWLVTEHLGRASSVTWERFERRSSGVVDAETERPPFDLDGVHLCVCLDVPKMPIKLYRQNLCTVGRSKFQC